MKKYSTKSDLKGFTLVEVMIGMMILVVAIVTTTSLLINIMNSNKMIANHLKAHYLAQESLEAVRNVRDTNWLNNKDWKSEEIFTDLSFKSGLYAVELNSNGWVNSKPEELTSITDMNAYLPWTFKSVSGDVFGNPEFLVKKVDGTDLYPEFYRYVEFEDYESADCESKADKDKDECNEDFVLARSVVVWRDLGREYKVTLEEVLSNWKGGAL